MMKKIFSLFVLTGLLTINGFAQQIGINEDGSLPNPNAILDVKSFNKGILIPRMSTAERVVIPNTRGLMVYDTTTQSFWYNTGSVWKNMEVNVSMNAGWMLTGNAGTTDSNFIGTTDNIPLRIKINNQADGSYNESSVYRSSICSPQRVYCAGSRKSSGGVRLSIQRIE
jgi:hypothetical protein